MVARGDLLNMNEQHITILLHCTELPGRHVGGSSTMRLGIQKGKDVIDDVVADGEALTFPCVLRVERNTETGKPNFLGPYAQGTPKERFIYLCWGQRIAGGWVGVGRAKIQLNGIEWHAVEHAMTSGQPIEAVLNMTDKKGRPLCASVPKDKINWQL